MRAESFATLGIMNCRGFSRNAPKSLNLKARPNGAGEGGRRLTER